MVAKTSRVVTHVFATLTYQRKEDSDTTWKRVTRDFNHFITYYRRLHIDGVEYLRTVEAHADGYPHLHAVLQLQHGVFVSNDRYFDPDLYKKWKSLWSCGLSDFQAPTLGPRNTVLYIVKYITKSSTKKTIWRKCYTGQIQENISARSVVVPTATSSTPQTAVQKPKINEDNPSTFLCKKYKIKQCTWSRGFKFPTLERKAFPEPPQCLLTKRTK